MHIDIKNLNVKVSNKEVLKDFNLNINEGEIHAIMGPNGTGKSTLSKVLMGHNSYEVTSGDILVNNHSILSLTTDERAKLGMFLAFQNPIDIPGVTNSEFLKTALNSKRDTNIGLYEFITELEKDLKALSLSKEMVHRGINENFSGGEKKKNEILQMKILKPKFIILDELDSGLDVDSLKIVCENINDYLNNNKDTSVLIITHYTRILEYIEPDFVHVMINGNIVKTSDYSLAMEIEKKGYKMFTSCASIVSEESKNE